MNHNSTYHLKMNCVALDRNGLKLFGSHEVAKKSLSSNCMLTRQVVKGAQKRVEGNNYDTQISPSI